MSEKSTCQDGKFYYFILYLLHKSERARAPLSAVKI